MSKKALVLCGGGAKGGYHVGVWNALKELGFKPDIITGTSVGALIGALLAIGEDAAANEIWENINMERVFDKKENSDINSIKSFDEFVVKLGKLGGVDPKPLKELVHALGDEKKFRESKIEFGIVTTQVKPPKKIEKFVDEMEEGKVTDYILASTACFPIMQPYNINGKDYVDGGYMDNVPFNMALKRGADELVIVDMHGMKHVSTPEDINAKVHYISPKHDLGNFIIFNKEQSQINIEMGYLDTMKLFGKYEGNYYTFELGSVNKSTQYNEKCKLLYKRVFTDLPKTSPIEKLATKSFRKFILDYNTDLFTNINHALDILEISAQIYDIPVNKIYSIDTLIEEIKKKYNDSIHDSNYKEMLSWNAIKNSISNLNDIKKVMNNYEKVDLIAYIVYLLSLPQLTMLQKNQILAITAIMPECLCAAICVSALCL